MAIEDGFTVIDNENGNKFNLPENLFIQGLYERNPLPIQLVNFSAVKEIEFCLRKKDIESGAEITNELICHVFRSSENLERVIFKSGFEDFMANTSNLLVIPTYRKLKYLKMSVSSPDRNISKLL